MRVFPFSHLTPLLYNAFTLKRVADLFCVFLKKVENICYRFVYLVFSI